MDEIAIKIKMFVISNFAFIQFAAFIVLLNVRFSTSEVLFNDGNYELIARQTADGTWFPSSTKATGKFNEGNPNAANFMDLSLLSSGSFLDDDSKYQFRMRWPSHPQYGENIWKQSTQPLATTVEGYEAIDVANTGHLWGGLERSGSAAVLDGSVNSGNWFYAIGSFAPYDGENVIFHR